MEASWEIEASRVGTLLGRQRVFPLGVVIEVIDIDSAVCRAQSCRGDRPELFWSEPIEVT